MENLNLPDYQFNISTEGESKKIWDEVRKKFVVLTPEEWVRQNLIQYLVTEKAYPKSLIKVESGLKVNQLFRRTDILIYSNDGKPALLVECKAADVKITQEVFDQIARYNIPLKVPYLLVSNGLKHYCCLLDYSKKSYRFLPDIPHYDEVSL